jgi:hypothetical protein
LAGTGVQKGYPKGIQADLVLMITECRQSLAKSLHNNAMNMDGRDRGVAVNSSYNTAGDDRQEFDKF